MTIVEPDLETQMKARWAQEVCDIGVAFPPCCFGWPKVVFADGWLVFCEAYAAAMERPRTQPSAEQARSLAAKYFRPESIEIETSSAPAMCSTVDCPRGTSLLFGALLRRFTLRGS
jgi:hypothetical protein